MLKVALIGYGKMGQTIDAVAPQMDIQVVSRIDPHHSSATRIISEESLNGAEVCIDFTSPDTVITNALAVAELGRDLVIGTTGWYEEIDSLSDIVKGTNIGVLYAPNFSIGIALFLKIVEQAAHLISAFDEYDVAGLELHHRSKTDRPSGTALALQALLKKALPRCEEHLEEFTSVRCGSTPGTHTILLDSSADTIELTHRARSREGFALGALKAAKWIAGRRGLYSFEDYLKKVLQEKAK